MQTDYESRNNAYVSSPMVGPRPKRKLVILVGAIVVVALIAAIVVVFKKGSGPAQRSPVAISSIVANVGIDAHGYLPKTISIKRGQEITWTNKDNLTHRLTADQSQLPGFETTESLEPGDSYTYIFDTHGTYHYYDPADPKKFVGTINVE